MGNRLHCIPALGLTVIVLVGGCLKAQFNATKPSVASRRDFVRALGRVKPGMTEAEVRAIVGDPDDVRTRSDSGGMSRPDIREIWRYGTDGHLSFATLGTIYFDDQGKVAEQTIWNEKVAVAYGGAGKPPPTSVLPEPELRSILRLIATAPSYRAGSTYDPLPIIRIVNRLQPLGKEKALSAIDEFLRVAEPPYGFGNGNDGSFARDGLFLVLRVLFEVPDDTGVMPPMVVGGASTGFPADPKQLPHFPILLVGDVPLLVVDSYMLGGQPEAVEKHVEYFRKHGRLRAKPLVPTGDPLSLLGHWQRVAGANLTLPEHHRWTVAEQIRHLLDSVYQPKIADLTTRRGGDFDADWRQMRTDVLRLAIRWNADQQQYTFADGTHLGERGMGRRLRHYWDAEIRPGKAQFEIERNAGKVVSVTINWWVEANRSLPPVVVSVVNVRDPTKPLAVWDRERVIKGGPEHRGTMTEHRHFEAPLGTEIQIRVRTGDREETSPIIQP